MSTFVERFNFSQKKGEEHAQKLQVGQEYGLVYDNLCLYCANNDIDLSEVDDFEFSSGVSLICEVHTKEIGEFFYFWIQ